MMKKVICILFSCVYLGACSGTPPRWWNPSGAYNEVETVSVRQQRVSSIKTSLPSRPAPEEEDPALLEQTFEPSADGYEELSLSPYPQTETLQEAAEQPEKKPASAPALEEDVAEELNISSSKSVLPKVAEVLPEDGSLPPPSVLQ